MITKEDLINSIKSIRDEIDEISPNICSQFPIQAYMDDVKSHVQFRTHSYFSFQRLRIFKKIRTHYGFHALVLYQKLVLASLIKDSTECIKPESLPKGIFIELYSWYKRILDDFTLQSDKYYDFTNIDFRYDLGICCLKSLPIGGAWFIQVRRLGFRLFLTLNIPRLLRILGHLIYKTGGFRNFCVIHTFPRYLPRFNCQQMNLAYKQIGELLKSNSKIKGVYRRSWFLDPNLVAISPNLNYLREIPLKNGAALFQTKLSEEDINLSLKYSPLRRKLYEAGKYFPAAYAYIWPRNEFLSYLENQTN
jgi:hypothetical protein